MHKPNLPQGESFEDKRETQFHYKAARESRATYPDFRRVCFGSDEAPLVPFNLSSALFEA